MSKQLPFKEALKTERLTPFGNAVAGALGAVVSSALVYPLDTVKTRIQGSTSASSSTARTGGPTRKEKNVILAVLLRTWKNEGLEGFFRGFGASMISTFSMQFAYFFFHSSLRTAVLRRSKVKSLSTSVELLLGALAGAFAQIFTIPVAVIATRQQLHESSKDTTVRDPTMFDTAKEIIDESGITGLWTGLKPGLVLTVNPAITYGVFEKLKGMVLNGAAVGDADVVKAISLGPGWSFLLGMTSKTLATVVTYPYIFAKVRLQAKPTKVVDTTSSKPETTPTEGESFADAVKHTPAHEHQDHLITSTDLEANKTDSPATESEQTHQAAPARKHTSAVELLKHTYAVHGFKGWYQGMSAQILKAVLSQGILFMLKDQFEAYALILMLLAKRALARR